MERESTDQVQRDIQIKLLAKIDDLNDNVEKAKKQINVNIEEFSNKLTAKSTKNAYALEELKICSSSLETRLTKRIEDKFTNLEKKVDRVFRGLETSQKNQEKDFYAFKREGGSLMDRIGEISEKLIEFEQNKRNNLIFYGIANDNGETHSTLNQKVKIRVTLNHSEIFFPDFRNIEN